MKSIQLVPPKQRRSSAITVKLHESEYEKVRTFAQSVGLPVANFARAAIGHAIEHPEHLGFKPRKKAGPLAVS